MTEVFQNAITQYNILKSQQGFLKAARGGKNIVLSIVLTHFLTSSFDYI